MGQGIKVGRCSPYRASQYAAKMGIKLNQADVKVKNVAAVMIFPTFRPLQNLEANSISWFPQSEMPRAFKAGLC